MDPSELPGYLDRLAARASAAAPAAVNAMGMAYQRVLVGSTLVRYTHPRGTKTPSPPGQPPALATGTLRRSVRLEPATGSGPVARASVAPHTVYARIQELGGHIYPVRARALRWTEDGTVHFARHVYLPERPYMRPTRTETVADGTLRRAAIDAFRAAAGV
jgi:hypothetical protein